MNAIIIDINITVTITAAASDLPWLWVHRCTRWRQTDGDDGDDDDGGDVGSSRSDTDSLRQRSPSPTCDTVQPLKPMTSPDVDAVPRLRSSRTRTRLLPGPT